MSEQIRDGGPAFPSKANNTDKFEGMSLRDWLAGQALAGLAANADPKLIEEIADGISGGRGIVDVAYQLADRALERRGK